MKYQEKEFITGETYGVNVNGLNDSELEKAITDFKKYMLNENDETSLYYQEIMETLNDMSEGVQSLMFANVKDFEKIENFLIEPLVACLDTDLFRLRLIINARLYGLENIYLYDVFTTDLEYILKADNDEIASQNLVSDLCSDLYDFYIDNDYLEEFEEYNEDTNEYDVDWDWMLQLNGINPYRLGEKDTTDRVINDFERANDCYYITYNKECYKVTNV